MSVNKYRGRPYHLWNPFTDMNELFTTLVWAPA